MALPLTPRYLSRFQVLYHQLVAPSCLSSLVDFRKCFSVFTKATPDNALDAHLTNYVVLQLPSLNKSLQLHPLWLRDHCRCPECYNSTTCQRNVDLLKLDDSTSVSNYSLIGDVLQITWSDGHESSYSTNWILNNTYEGKYDILRNVSQQVQLTTWDAKTINSLKLDSLNYSDIMCDEKSLAEVYRRVLQYGFVQIEEVPQDKLDNANLFERICRMSRTVFGTFWETGTNFDHKDSGYLNGFLEAHTDNTYFTEAQGLIAFHCTHFEGTGCESFFVDGFHVAEQLKRLNPQAYRYLSNTYMEAEYIEPGEHFLSYGVCFRHHPITNNLEQVRFNMLDRAPLAGIPQSEVGSYYKNLQFLASLVQKKENVYWANLRPGRVFIIDNWRLLHGRTEFSGRRVLRGCYFARSDFMSRARAYGVFR